MIGKSRETIKYARTTIVCTGILVGATVAYLYFLNMSVVQVVMRTEHTRAQQILNAEIAELEAKYIAAQHQVSARIATLDGYSTESQKVFVSRDKSSFVLGN